MAKPTVLDSFEASELVVTARLVSVEKIGEKQRERDISHIRSATMTVIKVYKGDVKPGQAMKFRQGGGADCVWTFREEWIGDEFLFYVGKPIKGHPLTGRNETDSEELMYYAVTCGRSNGLKGAIDDLSYLEKIGKVKGKTRLSGRFGAWWFNKDFKGGNIKLKVTGKNQTYNAKTDDNGFFEIFDLLPGEYIVSVEMPVGWKLNDYMLERTSTGYEPYDPRRASNSKDQIPIRIESGKHTALDLTFDIDTAIKGVVLSPEGKPMKSVCVKAVSTDLKEGDFRGHADCTDEKGEFLISEMARGNYILVVNDDGRMSGSNPFGVVFYPGVTEFRNAGVISVEPGKYVIGTKIQIPQTVELVTIKGKFVFSDGRAVGDEWVNFTPDDEKRYESMRQKTDVEGRFSFQLPKGASGKVSGEMYTYTGKFTKCEKLEAMIKESERNSLTIKSSVFDVSGLEASELIEITLPFPRCEKAKKD